MKNKKKKYFDAVQMVREIRDAIFKQATDPNFNPQEFQLIKEKWTKILEQQEKINTLHYYQQDVENQDLYPLQMAMEKEVKYKKRKAKIK